jgi:hypothetical protein
MRMASNLTKRLNKLERLIRGRSQVDHPPLYVSSAENAPEGALVIERVTLPSMRKSSCQHSRKSQATAKTFLEFASAA